MDNEIALNFTVRKLADDDASDWMRLRLEGAREFPLGFLIDEDEARKLTPERAREILGHGGMYGVFDADNLIGFCGLRQEFFKRTRHRAELGPFFVTADYHGRGAAKALMESVTSVAGDLGVEQLELFVDTENHPAIRFYEKFGFERIATHPDGVRINGVPRDDYFYRLRLGA